MMLILGAVIVVLAFAAIIKKVDARFVLFVAGALMTLIAGQGVSAITSKFYTGMTSSLATQLMSVMGFVYVCRHCGYYDHLIHVLSKPMALLRPVAVPLGALITFLVYIALPAASGVVATVGGLLIPMMLNMGVNPAAAAASIVMGTAGGAMFTPGNAVLTESASIAGMTLVEIMGVGAPAVIASNAAAFAALTAMDIYYQKKAQTNGYDPAEKAAQSEDFKVNFLYMLIPLLPLILILCSNAGFLPNIGVGPWMLIGCMIAMLVYFKDPQPLFNQMFEGMAFSFSKIVAIIACAGVFTLGMQELGLTGFLVNLMERATGTAKYVSAIGPYIMAMLSGSGDAIVTTFNTSVIPHAESFGLTIEAMGIMVNIAAGFGRTASLVAGVNFIAAGLAETKPSEVVKYNLIPTIIGLIVALIVVYI